MTTLNAQQLAFILDITKQTARDKMLFAYGAETNTKVRMKYKETQRDGEFVVKKKRQEDGDYPESMNIEMLSRRLNLPTLQAMVDDICNNYLTRPASKKWILCDYPEKKILANKEADKPAPVRIPTVLRSMLPQEQQERIMKEWIQRFGEKAINIYVPEKEEDEQAQA